MKGYIGNKRAPKIPLRTYEVLVTVTDDGKDGAGGYAYMTRKDIKGMLTEGARIWSGVKVRVNAIQELPPREGSIIPL